MLGYNCHIACYCAEAERERSKENILNGGRCLAVDFPSLRRELYSAY